MDALPHRISQSGHLSIGRLAAIALVLLLALAGSHPAFGDAIHDAARNGNLGKVQSLLKHNPDQVSGKDKNGATCLFTGRPTRDTKM